MNINDLLDRLSAAAETWVGTPIGGLLIDTHNAIEELAIAKEINNTKGNANQ